MNNLSCSHASIHFLTSFHFGGEWPKVDFYHLGYVKQEIGLLEIEILILIFLKEKINKANYIKITNFYNIKFCNYKTHEKFNFSEKW